MAVLRVVVTQSTESLLVVAMRSYFPTNLQELLATLVDTDPRSPPSAIPCADNIAVLPAGSMRPEPIAVTHKGPDCSGKDSSAPSVPGDLLRQFEFTLGLTGRRIVVYR